MKSIFELAKDFLYPSEKVITDGVVENTTTELMHDEENLQGKSNNSKRVLRELEEIRELCNGKKKDNVWAFCAGQYSNDFRGNPKWLFIYINKYRPDIVPYWLTIDDELADYVRGLGFRAYRIGTVQAEEIMNRTGVLVAEQVKAVIPEGLRNVKYLNLWHGVGGAKAVERALNVGFLTDEIAKKYINRNNFYRDNQLYLAPSPLIEEIAKREIGVKEEHIIKAGYPRCLYQKHYEKFSSFEHDLITKRGLPEDTKIVAYAPTYRNEPHGELFAQAIPNMDKLIATCEENHILMIFKMHPLLESEMSFKQAKEVYGDCPWLCFWDNDEDFYEIISDVDLCITDFSSIFTDFVAAGTQHYIRYVVDFVPEELDFPLGYDEAIIGRKCYNFEELLEALSNYEEEDMSAEVERIRQMHWPYEGKDSFDKIIEATLAMQCENITRPTLYSFDIFDTLISRKVLAPVGVFYYVQEKMRKSDVEFPSHLVANYPKVRANAESNVREFFNRSKAERDDDRCEIQFDYIFDRMNDIYSLTNEQMELLKKWELECEYDQSIPLTERIEYVKSLVSAGETVILISDMYLPKEEVKKLLAKADPVLAELPLYLSSEYGYQKSARNLYIEVYKQYGVDYNFGKWIHHGDNQHSDVKMPKQLNIRTVKVQRPTFNNFENGLVNKLGTYDAFLVAASMARFRMEHPLDKEQFAHNYVSLLFVPYIYWAVHDAISRGDEIIYFISRDGHHLKRIADRIIEAENLNIETKYIYASRRVWRIPSFIDHIDVGFWGQGYGNLAKISSYSKLLKALDINEEDFRRIFPQLSDMTDETDFDEIDIQQLTDIIRSSKEYEEYLLGVAAEERKVVCAYHEQEMSKDKQFSIVEYWGRGYTQENFTRLWHVIMGKKVPVTFYYSRSTLPSDEYNIRRDFTSIPNAQQFIESIFANMPYKSVEGYKFENDRWEPIISPLECDMRLFNSMMEYLPAFAEEYCSYECLDRDRLGRELIDYAIGYYGGNVSDPMFVKNLAPLVDSVELYGDKKEYAKELTLEDLEEIKNGKTRAQISKSIGMSYNRASQGVKDQFRKMFQIKQGESLVSGWKITDEEIAEADEMQDKLDKYQERLSKISKLYYSAQANCEVENKIIFLSNGKKPSLQSLETLRESLSSQDVYEVETIATGAIKMPTLAKKLAKAKYIIMEEPVGAISNVLFRPETEVILASPKPILYLASGLCKKYKLRPEKEYRDLRLKNEFTKIYLSSEAMIPAYKKSYNVNELTEYIVAGACSTDIYYNDEYATEVKARFLEQYPEAKGKKIICYVPIRRYREKEAEYLQLLDYSILSEQLGEEYFVITRFSSKAKGFSNRIDIPGFSKDVTAEMSNRDAMIIADIVVGDYRDAIFEAPLMNKPLYLTTWDMEKYSEANEELTPYEELIAGVEVRDTEDFIAKIKDVENYDYSNQQAFKEKYLAHCDGNVSKRIFEHLMELSH